MEFEKFIIILYFILLTIFLITGAHFINTIESKKVSVDTITKQNIYEIFYERIE
jgi:hypothetical protein